MGIGTQAVMWLFAGLICVLLLATLPAHAQTALRPLPENASPKSYGDGWECDIGFRLSIDRCVAIIVPENAYETSRSYGRGWECLHGFRMSEETACVAVFVPEGGFLGPSGTRWHCQRGFVKVGATCQKLVLPENAYLVDSVYGSKWVCNRGYKARNDACVAIKVPENAYLNTSGYGQPWTCERGFLEREGQCKAVVVPENAYFDDSTYGKGWKCARGYAASGQACELIDIPENAHLDRSGNRWECNRNFRKSKGQCNLDS